MRERDRLRAGVSVCLLCTYRSSREGEKEEEETGGGEIESVQLSGSERRRWR